MEATGGSSVMLVLTCRPRRYCNAKDHSLNPYLHESLKSRIKKLECRAAFNTLAGHVENYHLVGRENNLLVKIQ